MNAAEACKISACATKALSKLDVPSIAANTYSAEVESRRMEKFR